MSTTPNNERREETARTYSQAEVDAILRAAFPGKKPDLDAILALPPLPPRGEEPVAWRCTGCDRLSMNPSLDLAAIRSEGGISCCPERKLAPLYAAPPAPTNLQKVQSAPASQALERAKRNVQNADAILGATEAQAEPCFECGSTERIGTACKPCNPELAPAEAQARVEALEAALRDVEPLVEVVHSLATHPETRKSVWTKLKTVRALLSGSTPKPARVEITEEPIGPRRHGPGICRGCPAFETEDWREPSGDGETYDSGQYAWCRAADRKSMGAYHYDTSPTPSWCPALTAALSAALARDGES